MDKNLSRILCALALLSCLVPRGVRADALEEAKRTAKQAGIHYQLGRFAQAADAYAKSYELMPTAGLLFNLGQCQMSLKDYPKAIFFFEGYLRDKPDAPNAPLARDLIAEARREIAAQQSREAEAAAAQLAAARPVAAPPPPPPPPVPPRDWRRLPAVALGASSIALVGAALYLGQRADSAAAFSVFAGGSTAQAAAFDSDHRKFLIAASVTGGLAAACAISSGVLGYLGWSHSTRVGIAPTATGGAAMVAGSF